MKQVWIIDDDPSIRWVLEKALAQAEIPSRSFADADSALRALGRDQPNAIVTDLRMPGLDGLAFLREVQARWPKLPVIVMTAHSDLDNAVSAFQSGAFEYLPKPFDMDEAINLVRRALGSQEEPTASSQTEDADPAEMIGEAPAMQEVFRAIGRLSRSQINVLITGESGAGKELVASALHRHSPRARGPFIAINTAAIPAELLESELFGHEKGAFTGAVQTRQGRFEQASGGTLFLDEIGDMPAALQTRLLRVLSDGTFYRVGGHAPLRADVRVLAATHQNLEAKVRDGSFREDLYHRLNVIHIHLPPLRERREDIPRLARHFLRRSADQLDVERKLLSPAAEMAFTEWHWPGNVRQLENVCRWVTVMAPTSEVQITDLPPEMSVAAPLAELTEAPILQDWRLQLGTLVRQRLASGEESLLDKIQPQFERCMLEAALQHTRGHKQDAAQKLGWGRNTLTRKLKELGIEDH
ncbi:MULTISPECIES: nitrogen regulation protein NR(I) [Acidithiobacillus]|jgi:two-component system nitrogen regulation response regulator GlnG|uniref:DNA-binding transcriptional regulator NtrC n=2 Tax=Acidithiobacillus thiooxidans TaxID=930 RepID=A0A1C2J7K1_ACITH|nr:MULTISPECIES: nitrogen regulation protein NR(I) [Acidithiobacillus]MDD5471974.1 nitrogen regulation protein NR(I) [Sideroxydans sp.]MBU2740952.1 nitrogen regulation protein NR(I) [Acidithiobacillus albertensis]MBU2835979.1 nitrogen regulation protein NR(I) [Acidithiobacillus thiooxidans]MBU2843084.1 nitrogen regulation protein NR(I) [Acidithiobacillus thiooxidans]MDA8176207.1 nitrogen regulation protein NR(I) [Acidithiobacillus sp.]